MATIVDRVFAVLLMLCAGGGHAVGSVMMYRTQPVILLWALTASVLGVLLGALNLLRSFRGTDRALAWITAAGTFAWGVVSMVFGALIGRPLDPRVVLFEILSVGLVAFSLRVALSRRG
jgi:uncharacterized membrane protein